MTTNNKPVRHQRKRTKGSKLPSDVRCCDRTTKWGNPFRVGHKTRRPCGKYVTPATVIESIFYYAHWLYFMMDTKPSKYNLDELTGLDLACFCKLTDPCHVDFLLYVANNGRAGWAETADLILNPNSYMWTQMQESREQATISDDQQESDL